MSGHIKQFCKKAKLVLKEEKGQGLVEYALILVLIAVVVMGAVKVLGKNADDVFTEVGGKIAVSKTP
ncbi:MAG: Flp family type IVb pilin [Verrucomicrobia bacterium]|nr:Flp family type IVb pilin [Deltaproteobacteria bacterium]